MPEEMITIKEVCAYLQVSKASIYRMMKQKSFPGYRVGRGFRFYRSEIDEWLRQNRTK